MKKIILRIHILVFAAFVSTVASINISYGQAVRASKSAKKGNIKVNCIVIDAQNCCEGINYVPSCIPENSTLAIKVFNVNPFKTMVSAAGVTSVIDFGNDSLFSFKIIAPEPDSAPKPDVKVDKSISIKKTESNYRKLKKPADCCKEIAAINDEIKRLKQVTEIKISATRMEECNKTVSDALGQLTLLNRAEKQLRKLFDTTFITKPVFTKRMWSILECIGITKICDCKTKTDTCCNCSAHKKFAELYGIINEGYRCISEQYKKLNTTSKKAKIFSLSGKLLDKDNGFTVEIKNAKGTFEINEENELKPFFDNLATVIKKANSDSVKNALLTSAEYIDECISKLCSDTAKEFYQQSYVKGPVEGDYITVTPFLKKPNGDTINLKDFPAYKIRICGGFRANVSTGISFSFLGMNDNDFTIARTNNDTQFVIKQTEKGTNLYIPSLTTFIHFYNRSCGQLQNAVTMGLSVNPTSLESLKVMAGYSLIFGDERRGVFSIGIIAGGVNRLKTKYEKNTNLLYKDYPGLQETDLTAKRFRAGMFIGLSYNLSKLR